MLLIHGACSVLWHAKRMKHTDRRRSWALRLERNGGPSACHTGAALSFVSCIRLLGGVNYNDIYAFQRWSTA